MEATNYLKIFLLDLVKILGEMAPYLLLGFFFAGLLHAFIPQGKVRRFFGGGGWLSSVRAALLGVPLPLCSCGVIPTGAALYKNGASKGATVSFLISTPQTGVDSILATFSLMGLPLAIIRPVVALLTGITGGIVTGIVTAKEEEPRVFQEEAQEKRSFSQKLVDVFRYGFVVFIQDVSKWLIVGILLAAVISAVVPDSFFELLHLSPLVQMLLILVVSIPLYICATGSIPLAGVLMLKGISPGAAFVLLMAGPATNAATITMMWKVLGRKTTIVYLLSIIIGAFSTGLLIDYVLPAEWFISTLNQHLGHHHASSVPWLAWASGLILVLLIANGYLQKWLKSRKKQAMKHNEGEIPGVLLWVDGMTCNHCKLNIEKELQKLDGSPQVEVDLAAKTVRLQGENVVEQQAVSLIEALGYEVRRE